MVQENAVLMYTLEEAAPKPGMVGKGGAPGRW